MLWKITAILALFFIYSNLVKGQPQVPCHFVFGDSLSDAGNNNNLITIAKSNYSPYGIDFPGGVSTGRFTNGQTTAYFITQYLGFERFISPYSIAMGQDILRGVNYASGAAGILPESGSQLGDRISMDRQLENYGTTILRLQSMVRGPVSNYLNKCLYTVNIGSNDYIFNYFMPRYFPTKRLFTPDQFAQLLITRYEAQLQILYNYGARKLANYGLGPIGCIPAEIAMNNATQCVEEINQAVHLFNRKLESLVDLLNVNLRGAKLTFIDRSAMQFALLPPDFITDSPCCKVRGDFSCEPKSPPCGDRNLYAFMDGFHPTEVVNELVATIAFNTPIPSPFVHPMSIGQLISN